MYIQVGSYETLLDDSRALAKAIQGVGGEVTLDVHPEMQHVFHLLAGVAPEADDAIPSLAASVGWVAFGFSQPGWILLR
jgi:acetyl esterase/lipase